MPTAPPKGFAPHFRKSPVTDPWEPLFSRQIESAVRSAFISETSIAIPAAGSTVASSRHLLTTPWAVNLSVDYIGTAKLGQWLQIEPRVLRTGRSKSFADALITADGALIARANGIFRSLG